MRITSDVPELAPDAVRRMLGGLPDASGYGLHVKYLRYREKPHLSAWTEFNEKMITIQMPEPFLSFGEIVPYGAKRRPGKGLKFVWLTEGVTFRTRREVLRFLYCHEWMHVFGTTKSKGTVGETACDRFALRNYRRRAVTEWDADEALTRRGDASRP